MFMVAGRVKLIADDYMVVTSTNTEGKEVSLKVFVSGNMMKNVKEYTTIGDVCGVRGYFDNSPEQKKIILVADKVTFLSRPNSVSDTRGEEIDE
jgi:hypothetical protein